MTIQGDLKACVVFALLAAHCTSAPEPADGAVWAADSRSFTLHESGGLPPPRVAGGCDFNDHTYEYDAATGLLRHSGCYAQRRIDDAVVLDAGARAEVVAQVAALRTTSDLGCGEDLPDMVLTVAGAGAASVFNSSFYGRCPHRTTAAPFISSDALRALGAILAHTIATCPAGDAGVRCAVTDAGAADR